ncbi:hypothetical protein EDD17DRAFT_919813 [Pisolithus thermaeus]|nr:hypothetical protein EV401DRAFT_1566330 [Pisolithus croceorrhizus]KAI6159224.1 hypothetical protein EDD17DRAFT_919813 [Pisolithus thermaeus]
MILATHLRECTCTSTKPLPSPYFPDLSKRTPKLTHDFHLDTMFNPTWMNGPHVFAFDERGMVVVPGTTNAAVTTGHPGRIGTPSPVSSNPWRAPAVRSTLELSSTSSTATFTSSSATASSAEELSRIHKPWKLATLTEQDDAAFEELMAFVAAESLLQRVPLTAYAGATSVTTPTSTTMTGISEANWNAVLDQFSAEPSNRRPPSDDDVTDTDDATSNAEIEKKFPATPPACTMSPSSTSGASHSDESFVIPTPHQRGERVPFMVLHAQVPSPCVNEEEELRFEQEVALEKAFVGLERLRKKAPPPLRLEGQEVEVEWSCVLLQEGAGDDVGECTPVCNEVLSPLTAGLLVKPIDPL